MQVCGWKQPTSSARGARRSRSGRDWLRRLDPRPVPARYLPHHPPGSTSGAGLRLLPADPSTRAQALASRPHARFSRLCDFSELTLTPIRPRACCLRPHASRLQVRAPPYENAGAMPFFKLLRHIVDTEGWQRLYRGLGSALGGAGLSWALYFAWNDWFKRRMRTAKQTLKLTAMEEMLCAAAAGILTTLVVNPIWVINTRLKLAAQKRRKISAAAVDTTAAEEAPSTQQGRVIEVKEKNTMSAVIALVRKEGLLGWLSGIVPALILLINPAIQLAIYGWLRKWIQRRRGKAPHATDAFVMGAVSKFFAVIATFPAQTIKLRMQAGLRSQAGHSVWQEILAAETMSQRLSVIQALWTGVGNKMATSMLHAAVMFAVVELFRAFNRVVGRRHLKSLPTP